MNKFWGRVIREALQSGDGTLRLTFLMGAGFLIAAATAVLLIAARLVGVL
ncbi:hypothetical protein ACFV97_35340 [Streptomyces sp. NPDC059913]